MNYAEFRKKFYCYKNDLYYEALEQNRDRIRVKKAHTVVKNLEKIFEATLKISNKKGFQAMSMRNLSMESGLSMGALYAYFSSKEELIEMLQKQHSHIMSRVFKEELMPDMNPETKLEMAIQLHLFLSETIQPWFYFAYMEAKNMSRVKQEKAMASELASEKIFSDILMDGKKQDVFGDHDPVMTASLIKAMLQDWYLKRWKYRGRNVTVDEYAAAVIRFVRKKVARPAK